MKQKPRTSQETGGKTQRRKLNESKNRKKWKVFQIIIALINYQPA